MRDDPDRIREALGFIPADDRDTWVKMGMAIKSEVGDAGFDLWDGWSQQADTYNSRDARDVWKSIRRQWQGDGGHAVP
jgi:putative DNA primase/helicase